MTAAFSHERFCREQSLVLMNENDLLSRFLHGVDQKIRSRAGKISVVMLMIMPGEDTNTNISNNQLTANDYAVTRNFICSDSKPGLDWSWWPDLVAATETELIILMKQRDDERAKGLINNK